MYWARDLTTGHEGERNKGMAMLICIRRQGWHGVAVVVFALLVLEKCCMKAVDATGDGSGEGCCWNEGWAWMR